MPSNPLFEEEHWAVASCLGSFWAYSGRAEVVDPGNVNGVPSCC